MLESMIGTNSPLDRLRQRRGGLARGASGTGASHDRGPRPGLSASDERLLQYLLTHPMDYIDSPDFYEPDADFRIYDDAPDIQKPDVAWYRPLMDDLTPGSRHQTTKQTGTVLLTAEEERVLFLQYNYARHRVSELQKEIGSSGPTDEQAQELLRWYRTAVQYREQIAETNLALVLAMAKRTRMSEVDFADLVSEGNMALLRSVDKFDCGRGFKFSTYACRAILKAFSRQGMKLSKYRQRFPTDFDPALEKSNHLETTRRTHEEECAEEVKHIVLNNEADLTKVEQTVIHHRFGLGAKPGTQPLTLEQVGQIIGVTKERVRQIQNKALEKVRLFLEETAAPPSERGEDDPLHLSPN
ncbi:MAG: sigma-70 family RNA polymerase sigma factor [Planctomycetes bacterium]|nr:sigma-70 family RNA polymerase sigma factor [Planctomycetota bacterium]